MDIEVRQVGQALIVKPLAKRVDYGNASVLKGAMVDYINRNHVRIAVDLSEVEFMDSSGLSALLSTLKTVSRQGRMVVFGVNLNVGKLFSITKLDKGVFEIHASESQAVSSLSETR
ncbi:STAS domain-containing protein [Desulfonatronovibrio hydrogenovorans]|uniref:STAS domain-containing protein n=1 Tax=Desulfonatronovibrio hydrogenovorans TaxID=53245 RepID=UPI00048C4D2C|nr:STAS domain-containing protein [Desulfonatronovibrio hydrogenovorans]